MLEAQHLTKRYHGLPAVDDVSFEIRAGEILGYLGPNGSGLSSAAAHDSTMPIAVFVFAALAAAFRWVRTQTNHNRPLEFEDELPESTYGLHLNT